MNGIMGKFREIVENKEIVFAEDCFQNVVWSTASFLTERSPNLGFCLTGDWGTGKTTLLRAILEYVLDLSAENDNLICGDARSPLIIGTSVYDFKYPFIDERRFQEFTEARLLFIDDLGMENGSKETASFTRELVAELIIKRYVLGKRTVVATIFDFDNLEETYGQHTAEVIMETYRMLDLKELMREYVMNDCTMPCYHVPED